MDVQALRQLKPELDLFLERYAAWFGRDETQDHANRFVQGLLLGGDRRSVENIAEAIDGCVVRSLQKFIAQSPWSDDRVVEELQRHVSEVLGRFSATWSTLQRRRTLSGVGRRLWQFSGEHLGRCRDI